MEANMIPSFSNRKPCPIWVFRDCTAPNWKLSQPPMKPRCWSTQQRQKWQVPSRNAPDSSWGVSFLDFNISDLFFFFLSVGYDFPQAFVLKGTSFSMEMEIPACPVFWHWFCLYPQSSLFTLHWPFCFSLQSQSLQTPVLEFSIHLFSIWFLLNELTYPLCYRKGHTNPEILWGTEKKF